MHLNNCLSSFSLIFIFLLTPPLTINRILQIPGQTTQYNSKAPPGTWRRRSCRFDRHFCFFSGYLSILSSQQVIYVSPIYCKFSLSHTRNTLVYDHMTWTPDQLVLKGNGTPSCFAQKKCSVWSISSVMQTGSRQGNLRPAYAVFYYYYLFFF